MSNDDVLYIRKKTKHTFWVVVATLIPTAMIIIWAGVSNRIDERVKLEQKADKEYGVEE